MTGTDPSWPPETEVTVAVELLLDDGLTRRSQFSATDPVLGALLEAVSQRHNRALQARIFAVQSDTGPLRFAGSALAGIATHPPLSIEAGPRSTATFSDRRSGKTSAILVSMPFFSTFSPSLQIGLLAAIGRQCGHAVDTLHLNVEFAAGIGLELYEAFGSYRYPELGNWLFALDAFRDQAVDLEGRLLTEYPEVEELLRAHGLDARALHRLRNEGVPAYLRFAETIVDWSRYSVVGFSSTFQQNTASLALARRLKERHPNLLILFGGANFDGEMGREIVRACPWIDYAVEGDGDEAFPAFLTAIAEARSPDDIPGVFSRTRRSPGRSMFGKLDDLPVPDYREFFERAGKFAIYSGREFRLFFEASRGCWWGEKHHCTFCGLNGAAMHFRQKKAERVLSELAELHREYGTRHFGAADNIMPADFLRELVPALIEKKADYNLFFEIKGNLTRQQIESLSRAGVRKLQPGLESLNSAVLRLVRKGIRAAQNVNLLRWASYYGVEIHWNFLWGFPGELEAHYDDQAELIPSLVHLKPPGSFGRIWLERFSPFHFDRKQFPVRRLEPHRSLDFIYPAHIDRMKVAYMFEHEFEQELPEVAYREVARRLRDWQDRWQNEASPRPSLTFHASSEGLKIDDRRNPALPRTINLDVDAARLYLALSERPLSANALTEKESDLAPAQVRERLVRLVDHGLVMHDEDLFLSLAIPSTEADRTFSDFKTERA